MRQQISHTAIATARYINQSMQRAGVQLNIDKVGFQDFANDLEQPRHNSMIHVMLYDAACAIGLPAAQAMGVDDRTLSHRFGAGDLCVVSYDGEQAVGYDWYARRPLPFNQTPFLLALGDEWVVGYDAFTLPSHRGRGLAPDRWRAANLEFKRRGMRGVGLTIALGNTASLRASAKMTDLTWAGYLVYGGIGGRHLGWLSAGCRQAGVRLLKR